MAHFILIAGAFHGGWCWERLVPALVALGHDADAPDLPGMGDDPLPTGEATLPGWAEFVAERVRAAPRPPILVGHSRGGVVISQAAELVADRIAGLVYVAAVLLPNGKAAFDTPAEEGSRRQSFRMIASADGRTLSVHEDDIVPALYQKTDEAGQRRAMQAIGPEPVAGFTTPLRISDAGWGSARRAYVEALQDRVVTIASQRAMQAALPCDPVIAIDGDHMLNFSAPDELAHALDRIAAGWPA